MLLAFLRIVKLVASTLVAMARLHVNLFTMFRFLDNGHYCFVAMVAMEEALRVDETRGWGLVRCLTPIMPMCCPPRWFRVSAAAAVRVQSSSRAHIHPQHRSGCATICAS